MNKMKNFISVAKFSRRGFTLTEVLLAVMIVGLIGIALAALTRASAREGGVGRSRIMLRNNLSGFMRTVRRDLLQASFVENTAGALSDLSTDPVVLLQIKQNVDVNGNPLNVPGQVLTKRLITYCFQRGTDQADINPPGAYRGGKIYRLVAENTSVFPDCSNVTANDVVLEYVKYISSTEDGVNYPVPFFGRHVFSSVAGTNVLAIQLIVELRSKPVVNEVIEETFTVPMGS